jgi:hypothetical protein
MKQQSRGLDGCTPTTWPLDYEKCEVIRMIAAANDVPSDCGDARYPRPTGIAGGLFTVASYSVKTAQAIGRALGMGV